MKKLLLILSLILISQAPAYCEPIIVYMKGEALEECKRLRAEWYERALFNDHEWLTEDFESALRYRDKVFARLGITPKDGFTFDLKCGVILNDEAKKDYKRCEDI